MLKSYILTVPNVTTAFGRRPFNFSVPFEWNKLLFEMKLLHREFDYRKKLKTFLNLIFAFESTFEFINGA